MKRASTIGMLLVTGLFAWAADAAAEDYCGACGACKAPAMKWITVWETVEMEVPEKVTIDVERERPHRAFRKVQRMVDIPTFKELKTTVESTKKRVVFTEEEYDDFERVVRTIEVPTVKCVVSREPVVTEINVCREQYRWVEKEGRRVRVPEVVFDKVKLTSYREEQKLVDTTERRKVEEKVPVRKVRRIEHVVEEPTNKVVKRWVPVKEKRVLTQWEPVTSRKLVVERGCTVRMVKKPITFRKRVQVPAGFGRCPNRCDQGAVDAAAEMWFAEQAREERTRLAQDNQERIARIREALETGTIDESLTGIDAAGLAAMLADDSVIEELFSAEDGANTLDDMLDEAEAALDTEADV